MIKVQQLSYNATTHQVLMFISNGDRQIKIPIDVQYLKSICSMGKPTIETADTDILGKEGNTDTVIYYMFER